MRKRRPVFLNEYFLGSRSMGGFVLAMTLTATYISASSFIGGPGAAYKYGLGWVLLAMIQLPPSGFRWDSGQKICHSGAPL
jgi:sodium/pantothenate symporter